MKIHIRKHWVLLAAICAAGMSCAKQAPRPPATHNILRIWRTIPEAGSLALACFSPDERILICGSELTNGQEGGALTAWDMATRRRLWHQHLPNYPTALCFSPNGRYLAGILNLSNYTLLRYEDCVVIWDARTGRPVHVLARGTRPQAMAFSPSGDLLAIGGGNPFFHIDASLILYSTRGWRKLRVLSDDRQEAVVNLAFSPNGSRIVASDHAGEGSGIDSLAVWNRQGHLIHFIDLNPYEVWGIEPLLFLPGGRKIVVGDHIVDLDRRGGSPWKSLPNDPARTIGFIGPYAPGNRFYLYDWDTDTPLDNLEPPSKPRPLGVWDMVSQKRIRRICCLPLDDVVSAFAPRSGVLVTQNHKNSVNLWRLK